MFCIKSPTDIIYIIFHMQPNTFSVTQKAAGRHMQIHCMSDLKHIHHAVELHLCSKWICHAYSVVTQYRVQLAANARSVSMGK